MNDDVDENNDDDSKVNDEKRTTSKYFYYKTKVMGSTLDDNSTLDTDFVVPLNCLSYFWGSLKFPLINCKIELHLIWSRNCIISKISKTPEKGTDANTNAPVSADAATTKTSAIFPLNIAKIYVPVVALSIKNNIKILENIKLRF